MQRHERQRRAYDFMQARIDEEFLLSELAEAADWKPGSASTYISKHLKGLVERVDTGRYHVRPEFRRLTLGDYQRLADQTRRLYQAYDRDEYASVVAFEFLLPLTREEELRRALDDLFYADTIKRLLREVGAERFEEWVARGELESEDQYLDRIVDQTGEYFGGGYSISHVSGRFRGADLMTRREAADLLAADRRYLIDETTAIVRFIVPVGGSRLDVQSRPGDQIALPLPEQPPAVVLEVGDEVKYVRELFFSLFVEALIGNVEGEDQIWLIEEAPAGRRLHVWAPS